MGLEVCRAVVDSYTGDPRLEVGVGIHDRESFTVLHGDRPTAEALADVVRVVASHRSPGASPHPLNRLGAERLLRANVIANPSLIGAADLAPADPPIGRPNIKDPIPCVATGADASGQPVTAVFSSGIDLSLVPFAADARALHGGRLIIVLHERDAHAATRELINELAEPADLVTLT